MEATAAKMEEMSSMHESDFVYEAFQGAGKVGGHLHNIFVDTLYYAGKTFACVRSVCSGLKGSLYEGRSGGGKLTVRRLVKSDAVIEEGDRREFYMNLGRDMVEMTKSGLESENLTIIDLSKYEK